MLTVFANNCLEIEISQDVAVEYHRRLADQVFREFISARSSHWLRLDCVFQLNAMLRAVAEKLFDLVRLIRKRKGDVCDAGAAQSVDLIEQERSIANWHNRFRCVDS